MSPLQCVCMRPAYSPHARDVGYLHNPLPIFLAPWFPWRNQIQLVNSIYMYMVSQVFSYQRVKYSPHSWIFCKLILFQSWLLLLFTLLLLWHYWPYDNDFYSCHMVLCAKIWITWSTCFLHCLCCCIYDLAIEKN